VEEIFLERGIDISYETIRRWVEKFGPAIAHGLHRRQSQPGDYWHLDEGVVTIKGRKFWLWRAVDQHGVVLDEILQGRRDTAAAKRLLTRLMKKHGQTPKRFITDKLRSYGAAKREISPGVEHRSHKGLNNRAKTAICHSENVKGQCRAIGRPGELQRFVSIHSAIRNCFSVPARRRSALTIRYHRLEAFDAWNAVVNVG